MNVFSYDAQITSQLDQFRIFNAFLDAQNNLKPSAVPQKVQSAEYVIGNGERGTIKKITYAKDSKYKYAVQRVDEIDKANFKYSYSVIGGSPLGDKLEQISTEFKIEPYQSTTEGRLRSLLKFTSKYYTKENVSVGQEELDNGKRQAVELFRDIEEYLKNNPDACK